MLHELPRLATKLYNTSLAIHPAKARTLSDLFKDRLLGGEVTSETETPTPMMGTLNDRIRTKRDSYGNLIYQGPLVDGPIATVEIEGSLVDKGAWIGAQSGMTSYEALNIQVRDIIANDDIKGAVYEVDSYGGMVNGVYACAELLSQLSAKIPTIAILNENAYSAAYLLASCARAIVMPITGEAGSIGTMCMHVNRTGELDQLGWEVTVLKAGGHKDDLSSFKALEKDVADRIRKQLEDERQLFAATVGYNRGTRFSMQDALDTEAQCYTAAESLELGLVDYIADPRDAFEAFKSSLV